MRPLAPAAVLLLAACATLPPLRPADPTQAVPDDRSAATAFAEGIRIVVRPGAWDGADDVEQVLTPVEVAIHNASGRAVQVRPASFSLLVPGGFRYDALSAADVRRALGPARARAYGGVGYAFAPWGPPFYPWAGPYGGWWGWGGFGPSPWWGPVLVYGRPSAARIPSEALTKGTLEPGGNATILLFFPVSAQNLDALELDARLSDASGQKLPELRVPFVREGRHAVATPLPPTARPQAPAAPPTPPPPPVEPGTAPSAPGTWQTLPPPRPPATPSEPPPQQPPVDAPVGPPVPMPDAAPRSQ
jgi:hypothetical protein